MRSLRRAPTALALFALAVAAPAPRRVRAQEIEPRTPIDRLEIGARVHLQMNTSSADSAVSSEMLLRRARVTIAGDVNDWIDGIAQVDFSGSGASARLAYLRLTLAPELALSFGQFKRPFDIFELTYSSEILVVERDGSIRGVEACVGVGGACSYSRFTERLQHGSLDIGVLAAGRLSERVEYGVSLTNGAGRSAREENGAKSMAARLVVEAVPGLRVGGNLGLHDYPNEVTREDDYAPALALDVEWGEYASGTHLQAGVQTGDNWLNLDEAGEASRYLASQVILTHAFATAGRRIRAVEPLARLSWSDPDGDRPDDGGFLLTPGVILHFEGRNKLAANLDVWAPRGPAPAEWSLKLQSYFHF